MSVRTEFVESEFNFRTGTVIGALFNSADNNLRRNARAVNFVVMKIRNHFPVFIFERNIFRNDKTRSRFAKFHACSSFVKKRAFKLYFEIIPTRFGNRYVTFGIEHGNQRFAGKIVFVRQGSIDFYIRKRFDLNRVIESKTVYRIYLSFELRNFKPQCRVCQHTELK